MENFPSNMQTKIINQPNTVVDNNDLYFSSFPPGYRFSPSDAELVVHYLAKKILNQPLRRNRFVDLELYKYHPEQLSKHTTQGEGEWYFFSPRDRKYPNGNRPARSASSGYWKATGAEKAVWTDDKGLVGNRQALVFYEGKPPGGAKTNWMMHEYTMHNPPQRQRAGPNDMRLDDWVLCKVYEKGKNKKKSVEEESSEEHKSYRKRQRIESSGTVEEDGNTERPELMNDNGFHGTLGAVEEDANAERGEPQNDIDYLGTLDAGGDFIDQDFNIDQYLAEGKPEDSTPSSTARLPPSSDMNPLSGGMPLPSSDMNSLSGGMSPLSSDMNPVSGGMPLPSSDMNNLSGGMPHPSSDMNPLSEIPSGQLPCSEMTLLKIQSCMNSVSIMAPSSSDMNHFSGETPPPSSDMNNLLGIPSAQLPRSDVNYPPKMTPLQTHSYMNGFSGVPPPQSPYLNQNHLLGIPPLQPSSSDINHPSVMAQSQYPYSNLSGITPLQPSSSNMNHPSGVPPSQCPYLNQNHLSGITPLQPTSSDMNHPSGMTPLQRFSFIRRNSGTPLVQFTYSNMNSPSGTSLLRSPFSNMNLRSRTPLLRYRSSNMNVPSGTPPLQAPYSNMNCHSRTPPSQPLFPDDNYPGEPPFYRDTNNNNR